MVSKSSQMIMKDRTNKHDSYNAVNSKENDKNSSSYIMVATHVCLFFNSCVAVTPVTILWHNYAELCRSNHS